VGEGNEYASGLRVRQLALFLAVLKNPVLLKSMPEFGPRLFDDAELKAAAASLRAQCDRREEVDIVAIAEKAAEATGGNVEAFVEDWLKRIGMGQDAALALVPSYFSELTDAAHRKSFLHTLKDAERIALDPGSPLEDAWQLFDRSGDTIDRPKAMRIVLAGDFATVDEDGAEPLVGSPGEILIPAGGEVMIYGDGGAGKTTLCVDLAVHLAAGVDWHVFPIPSPVSVLLVENEGPRSLFRLKLRHRLNGSHGQDASDRLHVLSDPWSGFTFADSRHRASLADLIRRFEIDVVFVGPITCAGMVEAGTLQDTRQFASLVADVRNRSGRAVAFVLIHHEGKSGKVSGAWEGTTDTFIHVAGRGHGKTHLAIHKARWAPAYHGKTYDLLWTGNGEFAFDEKPELTNEAIAERIIQAVRDNPGAGWGKVEAAVPGIRADRRRAIRDRLLSEGRIVNVVKVDGKRRVLNAVLQGRPSSFYLPIDPVVLTLRPAPDEVGTEFPSAWGEAD